MADVSWTAEDLANLDAAIASGSLTVRSKNGDSVTYRSLDDMLRLRALIAASLQSTPTRRVTYARPGKGL